MIIFGYIVSTCLGDVYVGIGSLGHPQLYRKFKANLGNINSDTESRNGGRTIKEHSTTKGIQLVVEV